MICIEGKTAFSGIAIGPIREFAKKSSAVRRSHVDDTAAECTRFEEAKKVAMEELGALYDKAVKEVGEDNAAIFEVHQMMLDDEDYCDSIRNIITTQEVNAEFAVATTGDNFAAMFAGMDDEYMKARSADVKDISERLIAVLHHGSGAQSMEMEQAIILADDLAPSETIQLDRSKVLAFVTREGSTNSHTAILARTMNIPALVCTPAPDGMDGKMAIVDGMAGKIIIEPEESVLAEYQKKKEDESKRKELLSALKGKPTATKSGKSIKLYANIGGIGDVGAALMNDAEGIGLFRSEFLYLGRDSLPDETEQFNAYRQVLQMMAGKKVIIRTLDIGADKNVDYLGLGKEDNPAMGYRAIRICLEQPEIFKTQLRALLRAAKYGTLAIMYPMIISVEEVLDIQKIVAEVAKELEEEKLPYVIPEQGIMIETPAAVMMSEELAEHVDFFSIGTNDLTQYTLAIDRQNNRLDRFYNPHHEAVLRMIQMTVDGAHKHGKWVGICGELGADTTLTTRFVQMGIDELSVAPSMVLNVRSKICEME